MNNKKSQYIILFLVFLVVLLFGFGYFLNSKTKRHIICGSKLCNKLLNKYNTLKKASDKRVVLTFFSEDVDSINIDAMLNSILDQTVKVDRISFNTLKGNEEVPKRYKNIVNTHVCPKDYGNNSDLIPTLCRETESDTIIICIKPGIIYGKDFLESMIKFYEQNDCDFVNHEDGSLVTPEIFKPEIVGHNISNFPEKWRIENLVDNVVSKKFSYLKNKKLI
jgi:hypothetical protein